MRQLLTRLAGVVTASAALSVASVATAGTVTFDSVIATWSDAQGGVSVSFTGNGTNDATVTWGTSINGTGSGYNFTGITGPLDVSVPPGSTPDFVIGTFTHANQPIASDTSITGVRLTVSADVSLDGNFLGTYGFVYDIVHSETRNGSHTCADGGPNGVGVNANGCADYIQIDYRMLSDSIEIGADLYTLDIRGFELLDATKVFGLWTMETSNSEVYLLACVTLEEGALTNTVTQSSIASVPEPGILALVLTGLAGAGALGRRRSKRGAVARMR